MDNLVIYKGSEVSNFLISSDGITCKSAACPVLSEIKAAAKKSLVWITYYSNGRVRFEGRKNRLYNVPSKALQSLEAFKAWNLERIAKA